MDQGQPSEHPAQQDSTSVKPNLFIVGAPKCGTTAWVSYLSSHPDIFFSTPKEPHFFTTDAPNRRIVREEDLYLALFEAGRSSKIIGEGSTSYLYSKAAAANIRAFAPDAKILVFLRDQAEFLPSWHNQLVRNGTENIEDFATAWAMSDRRDPSNTPPDCRDRSLLNYEACGRFGEQVERLLGIFPARQVAIIKYRDWANDPRSTYLDILEFLGLEDDGRTNFQPANEARRSRSRWAHRLLMRPPRFAQALIRPLRAVTGRGSLGLGEALRSLNERSGYVGSISEQMKAEIRDYYTRDNALLERCISSLSRPSQRSARP